jgi:hypothetical protein
MVYTVDQKLIPIPRNAKGVFKYLLPKRKMVDPNTLSIEDAVSVLVGEHAKASDFWMHQEKNQIFDMYDDYLKEMGITKKYYRKPTFRKKGRNI